MAIHNITGYTWPSDNQILNFLNIRPFCAIFAMRNDVQGWASNGTLFNPKSNDYTEHGELNYNMGDGFVKMRDTGDNYGATGSTVIDPAFNAQSYNPAVSGARGDGWVWNMIKANSFASRQFVYETLASPIDTTVIGATAYNDFNLVSNDAGNSFAWLCFYRGTGPTIGEFNAIRAGTMHPQDVADFYEGYSFLNNKNSIKGIWPTLNSGGGENFIASMPFLPAPGGGGTTPPVETPVGNRYVMGHGSILF
jgi:hypothetical protein